MRDNSPATVALHSASAPRVALFGPFRFDRLNGVLSRDGREIPLPPRALAILTHLLERPGRVVAKQELIDAIWRDAFVSESSLTEAIGVLRQALGDSAASAVYIQTVHRRGYRFVAPLQFEPAASLVEAPRAAAPATTTPAGSPRRRYLTVGVIAAAAALIVWLALPGRRTPPVTRASITLPETVSPAPALAAHPVVTVSPDGGKLVYVAGSTGSYQLFLRARDSFEAVPIPGTSGGHGPFFSPDGLSVGFFRKGRLLVARLPDGEPLDIGAAGAGLGGWWHHDNTILVATGSASGIVRIAAEGGRATPVPVGQLNPASLRFPSVTPDGRMLLATAWRFNVRESQVVAVDLETATTRIIAHGVHARALTNTDVVFLEGGQLMRASLVDTGAAVPVLNGVMTGMTGAGQYALSSDGTLVYIPDRPARMLRRLRRLDARANEEALPFELRAFQNIAVSPQQDRIATTIYEAGAADLWVGDLARGTLLRLTREGGTVDPAWSPDGRHIYFGSTRSGAYRIYRVAADGSGEAATFTDVANATPTSAGNGFVLAQRLGTGGSLSVLRIDVDGTVADLVAEPSQGAAAARLSPDGQWFAYESNRTGRSEVFLRRLTGGADVQVSVTGGSQPSWSADGRFLYFLKRPEIYRMRFTSGRVDQPELVWADPTVVVARPLSSGLLVISTIEESRPLTTINIIVNWASEATASVRR